jgi:mannose/fructose-specific phosphotransferase system component IIA
MTAAPGRVPGILVAHAGLAFELRAAAEVIAGPAGDLVCLSNRDRHPDLLAGDVARALDGLGPEAMILVDLAGGSCLSAALRACRGRRGVSIVAGVNLPALLDYLQKRDSLPHRELLDHVVDRGRSGLKLVADGAGHAGDSGQD